MDEPLTAPVIAIVRFHRQHDVPSGQQPKGNLHHGQGVVTEGFFRGSNLAVGQLVHVETGTKKKYWYGPITERVDDQYTPAEGPAWFFTVQSTRYEVSADQDPETITVIVSTPSPPAPAVPQPNQVP